MKGTTSSLNIESTPNILKIPKLIPIESLSIVIFIALKLPNINVTKRAYLYTFLLIKNSKIQTAKKHSPNTFLQSKKE